MDYNSKYTGEQVEELLDKINGSPEDIATPTGDYPDMTVGKASQADTATRAINADNATNATNATTADSAATAGHAATAGAAESAEHANTAESAAHAGTANKADFATDLTGRNEATAEEFTFRPSAGNISIRDDSATIKRIKGNSVVWNQLSQVFPNDNTRINHGVSATNISDTHYIECSGTTTAIEGDNHIYVDSDIYQKIKGVIGHKYLFLVEGCRNLQINLYSFISPSKQITNGGTIVICTGNKYIRYSVFIPTSIPVGTTINEKISVLYIDLTQMFGAGNEPDTVEEFRALFPGNHYEYNPGQLVSMTANGLFTNGFNQWDEEWESGVYRYWSDGQKSDTAEYIRSANFIRVVPTKTYCLNIAQGVDAGVGFYDENNNFLGQASYSYSNNYRIFQVPANCQKITFYTKATTYNNDICINLSHTGVENGKYEPYWDATKDLSVIQKYFPNGMRSAGSIYDEISFDETTQKWVAIQRVGNVDLGTLTWTYSNNEFVSLSIESLMTYPATNRDTGNILCSKYSSHPYIGLSSLDKAIFTSWQTAQLKAIWIKDSAYSDTASFKTAISGVMLNYELAEPIVTVIEEPINLSYKVGDFGIEQILSDSFSAPFRADIIYQFNATDRIRENSLNIEKLSKTQNECLLLAGGTMSGQINSQDIKPVEDSTYQLGDSTHKYKNVFSDFFTGNLEGNAKTATVATDLSGRVEDTPEVFTYRPSAGEKSIKDDNAFIRRVKGNSVVWNQLIDYTKIWVRNTGIPELVKNSTLTQDGADFDFLVTTDSSTPYRIWLQNPTTQNWIKGHKYLILSNLQGNINETSNPLRYYGGFNIAAPYSNGEYGSIIVEPTANIKHSFALIQAAETTIPAGTYLKGHISIFDLTQMFGVGNEPATVEEFRALYPDSYYPYNAGELRNLDCSGIKTVGFNQWDEQWEVGYLKADGTTAGYVQNYIRAKNYIPVIGGAMYYASVPDGTSDAQLYAVDENYNFIKQIFPWANNRFFVPNGAAYIRFYLKYGSEVYNHDICINLHHTGYRDGEYEPYKEVTHSLPLSQITNGEPLRKAGSVYDEINETHYIKRVGVRPYTEGDEDDATLLTDGTNTNYPLAEPIVTPIETPIDFNYYVEDFGTEEAILAENSAPFSADIVYQFNATDQIRNNTRNINKLQKSALIPRGTSAQYIRGDGSYGDIVELSQFTPVNNGEFETTDEGNRQFILTPNYYARSQVTLDNTTAITVFVTAPEDSHYLAEYWFEFAVDDTLPNIEYYQPNNSKAVFRIDGDMMTDAVNILHLISSDGGNTFFGEIRNYSL